MNISHSQQIIDLKSMRSYLLLYTNKLLYTNRFPDDGRSLPCLENWKHEEPRFFF
jgi:hypothetical protein